MLHLETQVGIRQKLFSWKPKNPEFSDTIAPSQEIILRIKDDSNLIWSLIQNLIQFSSQFNFLGVPNVRSNRKSHC
jgi:hypothetical protein